MADDPVDGNEGKARLLKEGTICVGGALRTGADLSIAGVGSGRDKEDRDMVSVFRTLRTVPTDLLALLLTRLTIPQGFGNRAITGPEVSRDTSSFARNELSGIPRQFFRLLSPSIGAPLFLSLDQLCQVGCFPSRFYKLVFEEIFCARTLALAQAGD